MWLDQLNNELHEKKLNGALRLRVVSQSDTGSHVVIEGKSYHNFSSNDYLGLANHPDVKRAAMESIEKYGVGSGASHLVTGHHLEHHKLEKELAEYTGREAALFFDSGYKANNAVLETLLGKNDVVYQDKLNHASLVDGGLHCGAALRRYAHNDVAHLESLIEKAKQKSAPDSRHLVVSDSVFSMDGDIAPVSDLSAAAKKHNFALMLDDAHGFGVLGGRGAGIVEQAGLSQDDLPILMATLGKALGVGGAFVAGSQALIDTLVNGARNYIYSTAPPPSMASAARTALQILQAEPQRREQLRENVRHFRERLIQEDSVLASRLLDSETPIQGVVVGENERALSMSEALRKRGYWITAIRPPTVPTNTARLRITLSAAHSIEHVDGLIDALIESFGTSSLDAALMDSEQG